MVSKSVEWTTRLSQDMISQYSTSGKWSGLTLADVAMNRLREDPGKIAVIDGDFRLTFADLHSRALHLTRALQAMGLVAGDVISFQLPNWHEAMIINLAATMGAYVCNPIVPIYRDAEVAFILKDSRSKAFFTPHMFRGQNYAEIITRLRPGLPDLRHLISVRSRLDGFHPFDKLIVGGDVSHPGAAADPNKVKLLLYTSGTTGKPKGVLHSHNTLRAEIDAVIEYWRLRPDDAVLMASPVTHITGYLYALELPFACGATAVLMSQWDCAEAIRLMNAQDVTFSVGATPFLAELVSELERRNKAIPSLRLFACGGAPVPPELIMRAALILPSCITCRVYGSSEAPTVSLGVDSIACVERGATTDGFIFNNEVRVVDPATGIIASPGQEGEIVVRGPELMLGYTDATETAAAFDKEGFFHTGDLGAVSPDGFITISGRKKDIIIRGGENLSPKEIEDALHEHPAIDQVAVVAMPHHRMGETPAAYVVVKSGAVFTFEEMVEYLDQRKLAKQKFPEKLIIVGELPRNSAGKIQKNVLREWLAHID